MNRYIYYFLCFSLLIISCRNDDFTETIVEEGPRPAVVVGLIVDEDGVAVEGAEVILSENTMLTDVNGYFKFTSIAANAGGTVLKVEKDGYFDNYKFIFSKIGSQSYVKVAMVEAAVTGSFQASGMGTISDPSGAMISFPADAIAKDGSAYSGEVVVRSHWYDPSSDQLTATMPGDLRGINQENETVQLATLGMMAVELTTSDGDELQIAEGKTATLTFPLTSDMVSEVTNDVPLWSLNENTGVWEEEGIATLVGDKMVGEVSHFSFWNCDMPFPLVEIEGRLLSSLGNPVPNYTVNIKAKNSFLASYGTTNSNGVFQGKVPKDEPLELIVRYCGENVIQEDLGILTSDTDLGSFSITFSDFERQLTGRLLDCFGSPLVDGYVVVRSGFIVELLVPDGNGMISGLIRGCGTQPVTMIAYDPINIAQSAPINVDNNNDPLDLGDWEVCEQLAERIIFSINGGPNNLLSDAQVNLVDNELIHINGRDAITGFSFNTQVKLGNVGVAPSISSYLRGLDDTNTIVYNNCGSIYRNSGVICEDLEIEITDIGAVGDWLIGTITGNIDGMVIDGSFQLYLDDTFDTGRVEGRVWNDANENGIQDSGELSLSGIDINHYGEEDIGYPLVRETGKTDINGNYYHEGLVPGEDYILSARFNPNSSDYSVTSPNQGDNTSDSDFVDQGSVFGHHLYEIIDFTDTGLESNVDLGLIINGIVCNAYVSGCVPDAIITINPSGGLPPYEITLDGTITLALGEDTFENVSAGSHTVTVKDQSGLTCTDDEFIYEFTSSVFVQLWKDLAGGVADVFDENTDTWELEGINIHLYKNGVFYQTKTTDEKGRVFWGFVSSGDYKVTMDVPANHEFVMMNVGTDEDIDSDMDPLTNFTNEEVFLSNCDDRGRFSIGIREL